MKKIILCICLVIITICGCAEKRVTLRKFALDTEITVTIDKKDEKIAEEALKLCDKYENIFSRTRDGAELKKVNEGKIKPHGELLKLLLFGLDFSKKTGGAFDITVAPLCDLWNVKERTVPPDKEEIMNVLSLVGYEKVKAEPFDLGTAQADVGAVAKGYIADRLRDYFTDRNVNNVIIDLGGNVMLIGEYTVGIRDPFDTYAICKKIKLKDKSAVTSGAYQRYFEYQGKRYHHIIDPRSGECADGGFASVTVISPCSLYADALSTAIFILGEKGFELCNMYEDTEAFAVTWDGEIKATDGFNEKYSRD